MHTLPHLPAHKQAALQSPFLPNRPLTPSPSTHTPLTHAGRRVSTLDPTKTPKPQPEHACPHTSDSPVAVAPKGQQHQHPPKHRTRIQLLQLVPRAGHVQGQQLPLSVVGRVGPTCTQPHCLCARTPARSHLQVLAAVGRVAPTALLSHLGCCLWPCCPSCCPAHIRRSTSNMDTCERAAAAADAAAAKPAATAAASSNGGGGSGLCE